MTETEYRFNYVGGSQAKHFDAMLATVRDEAFGEAIEKLLALVSEPAKSALRDAIRLVIKKPPRTLDDVLGDIKGLAFSSDRCRWLQAIARTAVEGLRDSKIADGASSTGHSFSTGKLDETIRKLLEIR